MMLPFTIAIFAVCMATAWGAATDWVGYYSDPSYGGNLTSCVSLIGGIYYGQGLLSEVGYLRGTIVGNVWSGWYYIAGYEAIQGQFALTINTGTNTYTGTYTQTGSTISYTVTGVKYTSATPTPMECFQVDDSMLTSTTTFDLTSTYLACTPYCDDPWYYSATDSMLTGSYSYIYTTTGNVAPGTSYGPIYSYGQVVTANWYESGTDEGIELMVVKNASAVYNLWWFFARMSEFDYSLKSEDFMATHMLMKDFAVSAETSQEMSTEYVCYSLWSTTQEASCVLGASASDDDGDDDNMLYAVSASALAFTVATFVSVVVLLVLFLARGKSGPMANTASDNSKL